MKTILEGEKFTSTVIKKLTNSGLINFFSWALPIILVFKNSEYNSGKRVSILTDYYLHEIRRAQV